MRSLAQRRNLYSDNEYCEGVAGASVRTLGGGNLPEVFSVLGSGNLFRGGS